MDPEAFVVQSGFAIPKGSKLKQMSLPNDRTHYGIFDLAHSRLSTHPSNLLVLCSPCEDAFDKLRIAFNIFLPRPKTFLATPASRGDRVRREKDISNFHPGREAVVFDRLARGPTTNENVIDRYRTCFPNPVFLTLHLMNVLRRQNSRLVSTDRGFGRAKDNIALKTTPSESLSPSTMSVEMEAVLESFVQAHTSHSAPATFNQLPGQIYQASARKDDHDLRIPYSLVLDRRRTLEDLVRVRYTERAWMEEQAETAKLYRRGKEGTTGHHQHVR